VTLKSSASPSHLCDSQVICIPFSRSLGNSQVMEERCVATVRSPTRTQPSIVKCRDDLRGPTINNTVSLACLQLKKPHHHVRTSATDSLITDGFNSSCIFLRGKKFVVSLSLRFSYILAACVVPILYIKRAGTGWPQHPRWREVFAHWIVYPRSGLFSSSFFFVSPIRSSLEASR
jgi:hypothetical protein